MIGWGELTLIAILAIVLLGEDGVVKVVRSAAKLYAEYRKVLLQIQMEMESEKRYINERKYNNLKVGDSHEEVKDHGKNQ